MSHAPLLPFRSLVPELRAWPLGSFVGGLLESTRGMQCMMQESEVVVLLDGPTNIVREGAFRMK
eukprot:6413891-Amphidinium_carterae.1